MFYYFDSGADFKKFMEERDFGWFLVKKMGTFWCFYRYFGLIEWFKRGILEAEREFWSLKKDGI